MMDRHRRPMRQPDEGASALEFALLAPVLFLLLFGIVAFGLLFAQNLALGNSARQAARYAVVNNSTTCASVTAEATDAAKPLITLPNGAISVKRGSSAASAADVCGATTNKPCSGSASTDNIYVTISFDASVMVPVPGLGSTKHLTGVGVFRCEFS